MPLPTGASAGGARGPGGAGWRRRHWPCARRRSSSRCCRGRRSPAAGPRALRRPVTVPAATLTRSTALTTAPVPRTGERIGHADLRAVATEHRGTRPVPAGGGRVEPGRARRQPGRHGFDHRPHHGAVPRRVPRRLHLGHVLAVRVRGADAPALASATAVLQDIPHWPTQRAALEDRFERTAGWNAVAAAAAARDAGPVRRYAASNCAEVPTRGTE